MNLKEETKAFGKAFKKYENSGESYTSLDVWMAAKAHAAAQLEGYVVVPEDQAKDTARLNFMLLGSRIVSTDINCDENFERTDEGYCVNSVYWIDGFDRLTQTVHQTKREAIDAAMAEEAKADAGEK